MPGTAGAPWRTFRFGFKAREEEGLEVLQFKRTLGLVCFLFSPSTSSMEVVAVRGVERGQVHRQVQEDLKVVVRTEKGGLAARVVKHMKS